MNSGKTMTAELVFSKHKADKLSSIKNLNLWGHELSDVSMMWELPNVEIASFSLNGICSLKDFS